MDTRTMREFDVLCLDPVKPMSAPEIRRLRRRNRVSQAVFAAYLNTSLSTVQKRERGQKKIHEALEIRDGGAEGHS